jgi:hypothetical protein
MPYEALDWDKDKEEIFSTIKTANHADKTYYAGRRNALKDLGYDNQDIEAVLACERRCLAAMKKLLYVYVLDFCRRLSPEEAKRQAKPYLDEYNNSNEIMAQITPLVAQA